MPAELIEESVDIDATPEKVWAVISDLKRMGEWSPQCVKMIIRGGDVDLDTKTININRRGALVWPTTSKVVRFEPNKTIGWRITENNTVWSYSITPSENGVKLTERREAPGGKTSKISFTLVERFMGGNDNFDVELKAGMAETLGKIKKAAEA